MKTRTYLLLMLAAVILPLCGISALALGTLLQWERESRLHAVEEAANATSLLIDSEIAAAEASLNKMVDSEAFKAEDFARVHELLSATRSSPLSWSVIADYAGRGVINTLAPYGQPLPGRPGVWAANIYDAGKTHVSGYFVGTRTKKGVISVDVPATSGTGGRYVAMQIFDPDYFNKVFRRSALSKNWIIGVYDAQGISIARNMNAERFVGTRVREKLLAASRLHSSGVVKQYTREGIAVYDVFVRSPVTGWTVAMAVPVDQIESAARIAIWYATSALVAILVAAISIAVFFARRIDQALISATGSAKALRRGQRFQPARSPLREANVLLGVLHRTSVALSTESEARQRLEQERQRLLENEIAAKQRAVAENEAKDNFISMLSHELRNPLAAITAAVTLMDMTDAPPSKSAKAWAIVNRQLQHLTRMVDDLMDVRRVLSGKVRLDIRKVNIGDVLRLCCESRQVADVKRHRWTVDIQDAWVDADKTRIEQVMDNLLVNAVKYTPEGGAISVTSRQENGHVLIDIRDTGVGISPEILPTIFDTLVQGPTTIDRAQGGLGLGLSIAKGLVEMHNGQIHAASDGAGAGSTFTVRLPCAAG